MKKRLNRFNLSIILLLALLTVIAVKASAPYSVVINEIKTNVFPQIQLTVKVNDHDGLAENLFARHFSINENGQKNFSPMVVLPPNTPNSRINLYVLLDRTGNAKHYESIIKSNLKALIRYLISRNVDLKVYLSTFGNGEIPQDNNFIMYSGKDVNLPVAIDELPFEIGQNKRISGMEKINNIASQIPISGAENIALIINSSQFEDEDADFIRGTINKLYENQFITFVVGHPIKQLTALRTENTEDGSLSHSIPGGYLGSFSSDLTVIYDLLQKRRADHYVVQYFSNLSPSEAGNTQTELLIGDYSVADFTYPAVSTQAPELVYDPPDEALLGDPLNIRVQINNYQKFINRVEVNYGAKTLILGHKRDESTENTLIYTGEIPAEDIEGDYFDHSFAIYSPFDVVNPYDESFSVPVMQFDPNIILTSTIVNNNEILWRWEGDTVQKGKEFELWGGDILITTTNERHFIIPLDENGCNRYQVVKLRVLLKENADHSRAGTWSLFSLSAERYVGSEASISEKEGIQEMLKCLDPKTAISLESFIEGEDDYREDQDLSMAKMLSYITGVYDRSLQYEISLRRYPILYYLMRFISEWEYSYYNDENAEMPQSLLYKEITNINQSADFSETFNEAVDELIRRIMGKDTY